ncbi:MAG TPA: 2-amino-4-hydroxy-6-hydroxymethyldihydropteridine diphosphokinase [Gemmatimonadaceae bacterium]|nr:2-amino-4-hydroxy-6-hydroxymethyldihydropteridine diphosphokinase [Gemmatimonadaceae bacterium]
MADLPGRREPGIAYIALGGNVGAREEYLANARALLAALPGSRILAETQIEETAAIGPKPQANYLNQMVALETVISPLALLEHLLRIERQLGRERGEKWGPRTIDLDIVRYGNQAIDSERLTLPHPELPNRDFWQRELIELRGEWR